MKSSMEIGLHVFLEIRKTDTQTETRQLYIYRWFMRYSHIYFKTQFLHTSFHLRPWMIYCEKTKS